jgi:copper chaperone CopZ
MCKVLIITVLAAAAGRAEFRWIEQEFGGLECASCAESIGTRLKRLRGVESVEVDAAAGRVRITLAAENRVRLETVRDSLKGVGYTPGPARVRVRGTAEQAEGEWLFRVQGLDGAYRLAGEKRPAAGEMVVVEGKVPEQARPGVLPALEVDRLSR